ncbi:MAG TPA: CHASE3 domain-containing protein [Methylomirabilota bacterium]|nr:CHASE3 domain-containing protein [Methylomirabilota bacterium]
MPRTLTRGQIVAIALLVCALVADAALSIYNIREVANSVQWVSHTQEVLAKLEQVLSTLKDAETGQRGYLLTGDPQYLEPHEQALARMPGQLAQLRQLIADNPAQTVRLLRLEQLVTERLGVLQRGIGMYQADPDKARVLKSSRQALLSDEGQRLMEAVRAQVVEMQQTERALLARRDARSRAAARSALATAVIALGLGLLLVGMVIWLFTSNMAMRQRAADVMHAERERFRTTLTSIGDAVIVTDARGLITLLNPVARALTRWSGEAIGRPLEEVFRIVNEATREPAENPVAKVIRHGRVVGLANHTVLIARDGTELPIDDSGAPIRDSRGRIVGVVLVFRDITERRQVERSAEDADRRKDEFLAMLAHELRNPLAPIRNAAHTLGLVGGHDTRLRWVAEVIERQVGLMTRLVDDLLDVSRITSGKITLKRAPVPVREVVDQAVEMAQPAADVRKQTLEVDIAKDAGWVDADQARLVQAVGNLLDNAIKYTDEGGRIVIGARRDGGHAVIAVRDTGAGIAADLLPHVFDLFTQADRSLERRQGGLGLGLTLVRRLVEMHGGSVHVASEGPGLGSEFTIRLPRVDDVEGSVESNPAAATATGEPVPTAARRILVVDDEPDSTESLAMFLRLRGHEVRTVHDGPGALEEIARGRPEVVLLDLGLPGMSGYDVARHLRAQPENRDLRLVALTGYGTDADRVKTRAAGFDVHLAKPVDPQALEALLARWA